MAQCACRVTTHVRLWVCAVCAVVCEATYGVSRHLPREQREAHFLQRVTDTLRGGGRVLLPVVALGRAQVCFIAYERECVCALTCFCLSAAAFGGSRQGPGACVCAHACVCFGGRGM